MSGVFRAKDGRLLLLEPEKLSGPEVRTAWTFTIEEEGRPSRSVRILFPPRAGVREVVELMGRAFLELAGSSEEVPPAPGAS